MSVPVRKALLAALAAAAVLLAVLLAGDAARRYLATTGRYRTAFAAVAVPAPPGGSAAAFLAEVQYLAGLPDTLDRTDATLPARLAAAFALHPWVAAVDGVTVRDAIKVEVRFRTPALAVGDVVLDGTGVVLPPAAPTAGLPRLTGLAVPAGVAGLPHPDPFVVAAAKLADKLRPHQPRLQLVAWSIYPDFGLVLAKPDGGEPVRWGTPDGGAGDEAQVKHLLRMR